MSEVQAVENAQAEQPPVQHLVEPKVVEVMHGVILSTVLITFSYLWAITLYAWNVQF